MSLPVPEWLSEFAMRGHKPPYAEIDARGADIADWFENEFEIGVTPPPFVRFHIGADAKGRILEIGVIDTDEGELVCHAMECRAPWLSYALRP